MILHVLCHGTIYILEGVHKEVYIQHIGMCTVQSVTTVFHLYFMRKQFWFIAYVFCHNESLSISFVCLGFHFPISPCLSSNEAKPLIRSKCFEGTVRNGIGEYFFWNWKSRPTKSAKFVWFKFSFLFCKIKKNLTKSAKLCDKIYVI